MLTYHASVVQEFLFRMETRQNNDLFELNAQFKI